MSLVNAVLRPVFDFLLAPFAALPPMVPIALVSLLVSILMLLVFKRTSNQPALARVKRRIHAGIFEIRLFNDDLGAILRAQNRILRANLTYLRHTLWPMVFILPPVVLVMAQLQFHYAYEGLRPGQRALLEVDLARQAGSGERPQVRLDLPAGLRAETGAVWIPGESQLLWRLLAERDGDYELGGQAIVVKEGAVRLPDGTLAGSALTLDQAVRNIVEFTVASLPEAIQMATLTPARSIGVSNRKGSLEPGKDADIVFLDDDLNVLQTMVGGEVVYEA